jgi:Flp pilus assembly protein TadG
MLNSMCRQYLRRRPSRRFDRRGGAAVEAAFCIPLIILLMTGVLEVCSAIYLYESLKIAAFEGVRLGVRRGGTPQEVATRANEVLTARGIVIPTNNPQCGVVVTPSSFAALKAMDPIKVTITAPAVPNSLFAYSTFVSQSVKAEVTMVREFDE